MSRPSIELGTPNIVIREGGDSCPVIQKVIDARIQEVLSVSDAVSESYSVSVLTDSKK
jgi:hypothetical protein